MMEVQWRDEETYMTPTKKGKKRNKGKRVKSPQTQERPILNMPQRPRGRRLEVDWAKLADEVTNEKEPGNLEVFIGECLNNTNGLREYMLANEEYNNKYSD